MKAFEARVLFAYDASTGELTWRAGQQRRAGTRRTDGYMEVKCRGIRLMAHRLAWLLTYGRWPNGEIDHVNGDRADNRLCNLRECSRAENAQNRARMKNNSTGQTGVYWRASKKRYQARISVGGKRIYLGMFATLDEAAEAYRENKARLHVFAPVEREEF